jgi:NAD(P)-dependent dehydrogenase (short-subunit alcohol dehydrogenase family)
MSQVAGEPSAALPGERTLAGRVALVTGSGRGLGRAIAEQLAHLGAELAIHDISDSAPAEYGEAATLSETAQRVLGATGRGIAVSGDITDEIAIKQMVETVQSTLGRGPRVPGVNGAGVPRRPW